MKHFKRLTPEDYRRYVINPPDDFAGRITWYGHPVDMEYQDYWLVLAFLHPAAHPGILSFHLCHVDDEGLFFQEEDYETFDALNVPLGYWSFTQEAVTELIVILREHGGQLVESPHRDGPMFRRIEPQDLLKWNIRDISIPGMKSEKAYFYQTYDPLTKQDPSDSATIVLFSHSPESAAAKLFLSLSHFPRSALQDPSYDPLYNRGLGCINLDREGVEEFVQLVEQNRHFRGCEGETRSG